MKDRGYRLDRDGEPRLKWNEDLFKKNDPPSRKAAIRWGKNNGIILTENKDPYGPDLIYQDGSYAEVEHRIGWKGPTWPINWNWINIPKRKVKYFIDGNCDYVLPNSDYSYIAIIDRKTVQKYTSDEKYIRYVFNSQTKVKEPFYCIPIAEAVFGKDIKIEKL